MTNEDITKIARSLRRIHETADPLALCRCLDIQVDSFPMGPGKRALKGLIVRNSRCATISVTPTSLKGRSPSCSSMRSATMC